MPKFSVKDLLISTTLIAFGCGLLWKFFHPPQSWLSMRNGGWFMFITWFLTGMCFGAGIGAPLKEPLPGVVAGFFLSLVIGLVLAIVLVL